MKRIAIHSVPRSGSSWLGEILNSNENAIYKYQPLFSYVFKNRLNQKSTKKEIQRFFTELTVTKDDFIDQTLKRKNGILPDFLKEESPKFIIYKEVRYHHIIRNLITKDKEIKIVGLIRNPLSVINSWLSAPKEFRKDLGWNELEEWRFSKKKNLNKIEEFNGFEKWKKVAILFEGLKKKYQDRFYLLRYDDLLNNTEHEVKNLFLFCDIQYTKQTEDFILKSSNTDQSNEAYSVYREKQMDDKWKTRLNPAIIAEIQKELKNTPLAKYL